MFEIINDMDKIITEERLLACIPGSRAELYEDDVADLLEEIQDADAMHPAAAFAAVQLDGVEGDAIKVGDTSVSASLFAENNICSFTLLASSFVLLASPTAL